MKFVFGCGGTGGHIVPAIAIAKRIQKLGHECLFIGNRDSMESRLVPEAGFSFAGIHVQKLYRKLSLSHLLFPFYLLSSTLRSITILKMFSAETVLCTGGFVSGPVALAALLCRIPCYFHESNSLPGITTKLFAPYLKATFISFPGARKHLKKGNLIDSGVPIMERENDEGDFDFSKYGLSGTKPIILVTGGSQGSLAINNAIDKALDRIQSMGFELIWQTGKTGYATFKAKHSSKTGLLMFDFSTKLTSLFPKAKIAICRAGALTLAELEHQALPAILIPLPSSAENHQFFNAQEQEKRGLAILLEQKHLNTETLCENIAYIDTHQADFHARFKQLKPNTHAADIAQYLINHLSDKEKDHVRQN
ncbi:MAG: UDP-N-acetylglucosamine--N-acetylmuramyl-(pentapeptide) pyrophosphoryl-undecaprenol N-acetylglucosamine transferase [Candidatus Cloacimonadaceae bacterium]|nr:UDP-N-acetylglucosamine--N-acetylmuramyl-(pentapeptide) pyrophosphoryl-undecaprenol N-acetylglucosamine transferase [Candidatus Cloacimonadaceae bacterium]MDP3113619.1 UDP-N-acetylglucosamine--N-acetylmuramyl-(pentapeptide) pyrophosphoryl-undecaprenol N-acetylglucosamine transferase [Candidatus Cloacimonadaceae bacterium]